MDKIMAAAVVVVAVVNVWAVTVAPLMAVEVTITKVVIMGPWLCPQW